MNIFQAVILGIVQGISEFLPISSSGHLVVLQQVFGINEPGMLFNVVVHLGTLCAVIAVFWRDIISLVRKPFQKMTGLLIVATLPAVVVGFLFKDEIESIFSKALFLAMTFTFTGVMLWIADRFTKGKKQEKDITYSDALVIGFMQAVGIPPGVSRSGSTITGALACGLNRETAARFSFLLSIIAIVGAGVLEGYDLYSAKTAFDTANLLPYMMGFLAAALSGYLAVRLLLKLIKVCKLKYFSYYLFALAALLILDSIVLNIFFEA